jgi:RNA polymerase sigma-70 factor (ECF subfamily)
MFAAYYPALCSFVQSYVHTPDAAEELVQSVFLRLWEQRATWEPAGIRPYLFGACRNRALSYRRHERIVARFEERVAREDLAAASSAHAPPAPDEDLYAAELAEALRRAVHELPERRRQVVILRWEHHLSHAEIARILGISIKTVEVQFGRAIAALRKRLQTFRP